MIERFATNSRLSRVVVHNGIAYISGAGPDTVTASAGEQTKEVLNKIESYLAMAGTDKSKLLSAIIWVTDLKDFDSINEAWESWLPDNCAPSRSCAQAIPAMSQFALAITVTAAVA